MGTYNL